MKCSLQSKGFQNTIPYRVNIVHRLKNSRSTVSFYNVLFYTYHRSPIDLIDFDALKIYFTMPPIGLRHKFIKWIAVPTFKVYNRCLQSSKHEADINIVETHEARLLNWISVIKRRIKEKKSRARDRKDESRLASIFHANISRRYGPL